MYAYAYVVRRTDFGCARAVQEVTGTLTSIEELAENLLTRAPQVTAVHERLAPHCPRNARALVDYRASDVDLKFGDEVTVLEASEAPVSTAEKMDMTAAALGPFGGRWKVLSLSLYHFRVLCLKNSHSHIVH